MEQKPNQRITCGIIEKAALHRDIIVRYIDKLPELELSWECEFRETAHAYFELSVPDMLFMSLHQIPVDVEPILRPILMYHEGIVITTGYYADQVGDIPFPYIDYLLKPFSFEKFKASVDRYKLLRNYPLKT